MRQAVGILSSLVVIAVGCSSSAPPKDQRLCTPGAYVFCRCKDFRDGTKLCHEDGQGFDECDCGPPLEDTGPVEDTAPPDTTPPDDTATDADDGGIPLKPIQGDILITEVMYDPSTAEPDTEWIEIYCAAEGPRSINGLVIRDGNNHTHTIAATPPMSIGRHAYAILARSKTAALAAKVPSGSILYEWGTGLLPSQGVLLANGSSGGVSLEDGAVTIAQAPYGGWFTLTSPGGKSIQLKTLDFAAAASSANWCLSSKAWASGADMGTPRAASDCP